VASPIYVLREHSFMVAQVARLVVYYKQTHNATVELTKPEFHIGYHQDNDLVLRYPNVADRHAQVQHTSTGHLLIDLGSESGTWMGDRKIPAQEPQILEDGLSFRIGPYTLAYHASPETEFSPAPTALPETELSVSHPAEPDNAEAQPVSDPGTTPGGKQLPTQDSLARIERKVLPAHSYQEKKDVSSYLNYLPTIYHVDKDPRNDFLGRYLLIFESLWEPLEHRQDHIAMYFAPSTCMTGFLPWMASWFGLPIDLYVPHDTDDTAPFYTASGSEGRQSFGHTTTGPRLLLPEHRFRTLLTQLMEIYRRRGTRDGLIRLIEACTGLTPVIDDETTSAFVFRIEIKIPAGSQVKRELIEALIQAHKPAHVGYELVIAEV
jgi:hypothetical protein